MQKLGLIFGGKSTEHEISIISSRNIYHNLDRQKFEPYLIFIDKEGGWYHMYHEQYEAGDFNFTDDQKLSLDLSGKRFRFYEANKRDSAVGLDVIFPVLHGPNGEDGTLQGLLEVANIAYVGPGVLGSAVSMDKDIAKKLLDSAGIAVADYFCFRLWEKDQIDYDQIATKLGWPVVIKPANAGSSVGISKANDFKELKNAIDFAFEFDTKVLVEEYVKGREIEVAVLGNEHPVASVPGEIVSEFYDYKEKYSKESKTRLDAPAEKLSEDEIKMLQETAIKAYNTLECDGLSRVDFFYTPEKVYINEINTIPGFTNISMYPKLFELSGISQTDLITKLLDLAVMKFQQKNSLKSSIQPEL